MGKQNEILSFDVSKTDVGSDCGNGVSERGGEMVRTVLCAVTLKIEKKLDEAETESEKRKE